MVYYLLSDKDDIEKQLINQLHNKRYNFCGKTMRYIKRMLGKLNSTLEKLERAIYDRYMSEIEIIII